MGWCWVGDALVGWTLGLARESFWGGSYLPEKYFVITPIFSAGRSKSHRGLNDVDTTACYIGGEV